MSDGCVSRDWRCPVKKFGGSSQTFESCNLQDSVARYEKWFQFMNTATISTKFNCIFIPNVLKFGRAYGSINRELLFRAGPYSQRGGEGLCAWEHFHCYVEPDGLNERITLVEVSWSLHFVSEIYLSRSGCMGRYSNVDDLPGVPSLRELERNKEGVGRSVQRERGHSL